MRVFYFQHDTAVGGSVAGERAFLEDRVKPEMLNVPVYELRTYVVCVNAGVTRGSPILKRPNTCIWIVPGTVEEE